jgi:hypothetical protein
VRKKWLTLPLGTALATLAVVALLVWLAAEDAHQAALLDARVRAAEDRVAQTSRRSRQLVRDGAPEEEVVQACQEDIEALQEMKTLRTERWCRQQSWHARLAREARRRTGW